MQSNALDLLHLISQKTNFLQNWTLNKHTKTPPKLPSLASTQQYCRQRVSTQLIKLKHRKSNIPQKTKHSVIMLDKIVELEEASPRNNKSSAIKPKVFRKITVSSLAGNRQSNQKTDGSIKTINLYEGTTNKNPRSSVQNIQEQQCAFTNSKIMASFHRKSKSTVVRTQQSAVNRKKFLNGFNRYFQNAIINQFYRRKKQTSISNDQISEPQLRATRFKVYSQHRNNFIVSLKKQRKSLDIL